MPTEIFGSGGGMKNTGFRPQIKGYVFYTTSDKSFPGVKAGEVIPFTVNVSGGDNNHRNLGATSGSWDIGFSGGTIMHGSWHGVKGHQCGGDSWANGCCLWALLGWDMSRIMNITSAGGTVTSWFEKK